MVVEMASNHGVNQVPSGKNYSIELGFLRLGVILYEIAGSSEKRGDIRSLDSEGENVEGNADNHKPSALAILSKVAVRK